MRIRIMAVLLLLAMLGSLLACGVQNAQEAGGPETDSPETGVEKKTLTLVDADGKTNYVIVRPDDLDAKTATVQAAVTLYRAIGETLGSSIALKTDFDGREDFSARAEILIGLTNRSISRESAAALSANEYRYVQSGNKFVIVGGSDYALERAVSDFISTCLSKEGLLVEEGIDRVTRLNTDVLQLLTLKGTDVDLSEWAYVWRRDVKIQKQAEAYFIPRRLDRIDNVYREHLSRLGENAAASVAYVNQTDMLETFLPKPEQPLLAGLLWVGGIADYEVTLVFPEGVAAPDPDTIEVRTYPTNWGWFGWTVDRQMTRTGGDGSFRYLPPAGLQIDYSYNEKSDAYTEMIAVFAPKGTPVPEIRVTGNGLGVWKEMDFTLEWGFMEGFPDWDGTIESHVSMVALDRAEGHKAYFKCLYSEDAKYGLDSSVTVVLDREKGIGATVKILDLLNGPVLVPEAGLFFCPKGQEMTAETYLEQVRAKGLKSIREQVASYDEPDSWQEIVQNARLWRTTEGAEFVSYPDVPDPAVNIIVPDEDLTQLYRIVVNQLRGKNLWGTLGLEVFRPCAAMELVGLGDYSESVYDYFLSSPGVKPDADYSDGTGSLEWAPSMRNDMAYLHEGCHFSTGGLLYAMMQHYRMTGDEEWLEDRLPRLKEAADWIIRMLRTYMQDECPIRERLQVYGLMPPAMMGDYAMPSSDWHWYYHDNALSQLGLRYFAEVLDSIADPDADQYLKEAEQYEKDLLAAVTRETLYAPVRTASDGFYHSYIPRMAYGGGLLQFGSESNVPQFDRGRIDLFQGSLALAAFVGGVMDPNDPRMAATVDALEEFGLALHIADLQSTAKQSSDENAPDPDDVWYWNTFSNLSKLALNANIYLREDDIPSFLRFFFNHAAVMVGRDGYLWEHAHTDSYTDCETPDNGTAGWFIEMFRSMLVMEEEDALWITRGCPRAWLEAGKTISAEDAPTAYGEISYTISSSSDEKTVTAEIDMPDRETVPALKIRFRLPEGKAISSATVNGKTVTVDADGETLTILNPADKLEIRIVARV